MQPLREIACLFSHKCNGEGHEIGKKLEMSLAPLGIRLEIDPFSPGHDVQLRMQTFDIEAVLFLSTPESIASEQCQLELRAATRQGLPIFTAYLRGDLPIWLKKRSFWRVPMNAQEFAAGTQVLAAATKERVAFHRQIRLLYPDNYFLETSQVARNIAMTGERTLIAEYACELAIRYRRITDPGTLYWIALALGKANTVQASKLLDHLPKGDHPLILEGIRQAKATITV